MKMRYLGRGASFDQFKCMPLPTQVPTRVVHPTVRIFAARIVYHAGHRVGVLSAAAESKAERHSRLGGVCGAILECNGCQGDAVHPVGFVRSTVSKVLSGRHVDHCHGDGPRGRGLRALDVWGWPVGVGVHE
jgi:hypothetical protein